MVLFVQDTRSVSLKRLSCVPSFDLKKTTGGTWQCLLHWIFVCITFLVNAAYMRQVYQYNMHEKWCFGTHLSFEGNLWYPYNGWLLTPQRLVFIWNTYLDIIENQRNVSLFSCCKSSKEIRTRRITCTWAS